MLHHGRRRVRAEAAKRAIHGRSQSPDLIGTDTVFRDITADNVGDQAQIDFLSAVLICHILPPSALIEVYVVDQGLSAISLPQDFELRCSFPADLRSVFGLPPL
jgi:hypothetical protein